MSGVVTGGALQAYTAALVLPAVVLGEVLRPELRPGVGVRAAGWEMRPVACGRDLD